jgi:hypothetical protein
MRRKAWTGDGVQKPGTIHFEDRAQCAWREDLHFPAQPIAHRYKRLAPSHHLENRVL